MQPDSLLSITADHTTAPENDANVQETALLDGRICLLQPVKGYRTAIDPVFLAAAVNLPMGSHILDVGSGTGAATLCLAARCPDLHLTGLEIGGDILELARISAIRSGLAARVHFRQGDVASPPPELENAFDGVMTNPPYVSNGTPSPLLHKDRAHRESPQVPLKLWIRACLGFLRPKGRLYVVYRADRLKDLMEALGKQAGDVHLYPLWPRAGEPARRLLLSARKGVRSPTTLLPGMVLHDKGGYTRQAEDVLRHMKALDMGCPGGRQGL